MNHPKFIAIDASTNSMALCLFEHGKIMAVGKINFDGKDAYHKALDASNKVQAFFKHPDFFNTKNIIIEHAIFMNSPKTAVELALVQGSIIGAAGQAGVSAVGKVAPITWQNFIGNKKLTKDEQFAIRAKNPGKSDSWYKSYERNFRKERTMKLIDVLYDRKIEDNDVADACGIAHWAANNWEKAIS